MNIFISTHNYIIMNIDLLEKQFLQEYEDIIESLNINFDTRLTIGRPVKYILDEQKRDAKRIYNKTYYYKKRGLDYQRSLSARKPLDHLTCLSF